MSTNPIIYIEADKLKVSYNAITALSTSGLQLSGNVISVVGHNGAGKSTLIKTILQLLTPKQGKLVVSELNQEGVPVALTSDRDMAFCPEEGAVFADISVRSYIEMWCRLKHRDPEYYLKQEEELLNELDIDLLLDRLGRELSKGERRRVQTFIGFLCNPKLFLLDEPFDGLDVQRTDQLANIISRQAIERCFLISSHRLDVVENLSDLVIVLKAGKFIASGKPGDVAQKLSGATLVIEATRYDSRLLPFLENRFPGFAFRNQGRRVYITGKSIPVESIESSLKEDKFEISNFSKQRPTLAEAMSYQFKE